jgi:hypothetical protein
MIFTPGMYGPRTMAEAQPCGRLQRSCAAWVRQQNGTAAAGAAKMLITHSYDIDPRVVFVLLLNTAECQHYRGLKWRESISDATLWIGRDRFWHHHFGLA